MALGLYRRLRARVASLDAVEIISADAMRLVCSRTGAAPPFPTASGVYLLVECASRDDPLEELSQAVEGAPGVLDTAVGTTARERAALWAYRERLTEAVNASGVPHKLDVAVPLGRLAAFEDALIARVAEVDPAARLVLFGHLGEGNLHVNVLGVASADETVDETVLRLVAEYGGSISAEHGVGVVKRRWLSLTRSPADIAAMRAVKHALDPSGILNPGVLIDPP